MPKEHKLIPCESLNYCIKNKGLEGFAYSIMSSHMHIITKAKGMSLSDIIRDF